MAEKIAEEKPPVNTPAATPAAKSNEKTAHETFYRFSRVESDSADEKERTIQVAFSSETPVLRKAGASEEALGIAKKGEKYLELLSHEEGDADFSDLNRAGAPVLDEHKDAFQIGNVKRAVLSKDKRGRAVLQFDGVTDLSKTRFEQMRSGTRPNISFGYVQTRFIGDEPLPDGRTAKRIAFAADEISSVARPADPTVGARRSADGKWSCLGCGAMYDTADLDDNFECPDCRARDSGERSEHSTPKENNAAVADAPLQRSVDSPNLLIESVDHLTPEQTQILRTKLMATETAPALDEKKIRSEEAAATRVTVENEFKTRSESEAKALKTRNDEIVAIADELVKDHGTKWNGPAGKVFVVGERIRALAAEAIQAPAVKPAAEVRLDFKTRAHELIVGARNPKNQTEVAVLPAEISSRCSLRTIYNAAARSKDRTPCFMPKDGAELEAHQEIHTRAADFPGGTECLGEGIQFPVNAGIDTRALTRSQRLQRDSLASDYATAGAMIAPQYIFPIIELLRNKPALARAGLTYLSGVMGNLVMPRQEAATTAQSIGEGAALTAYDQVLGDIRMTPKRVGSHQKYSRLAMLQTTPDFEAFVLQDHLAQIALWIDYMGLNGDGSGDQPTGLINQIGVQSVTFGGAASYANVMQFETLIRSANVDDPISFISTSTTRGKLRLAPETLTGSTVVSGSTNAIWKGNDTVLDRPAVDSQQVPGNKLIAGAFRHMILAQWGGLAIVLDTLSLAEYDKYKLSINTYIDFALRHAQAFCVSADSAAQ